MIGVGSSGGGAVTGTGTSVPAALLATPRQDRNLLFTIVLTVAILVGAAIMALVLVVSGAPGELVVGVLLAAVPVGPVVAAYLWLDRYEPEPLSLICMALGWGAFVATAGALVLQLLDQVVFGTPDTWSVAIVAPITEEAAKGFFILILLWWRRNEIDGILDGIVYAGLVGVGFAFTENILYLSSAYTGADGLGQGGAGAATMLFIIRGVFSPFAHPLFTAATGIGVGIAVMSTHRSTRFGAPLIGYLVAVSAHAAWNSSVFLGGGGAFVLTYLGAMVPAFLMVAAFALWVRRREGQMLIRSLTDCADHGFLACEEVPWLARLKARRVARAYAMNAGGRPALQAMRAYQQQATELGFLHDRFRRGTGPADLAARGSVMVERLTALRPYVLYPRPAGREFLGQWPTREGW